MTSSSARDAASLADTIGTALEQLLRMHLVISDLRVHYWMVVAIGVVVGLCCTSSVAYGIAWLALGARGIAGLDPTGMIVGGVAVLLPATFLCVHRLSTLSVLLRTMRSELSILEEATASARAEARAAGLSAA